VLLADVHDTERFPGRNTRPDPAHPWTGRELSWWDRDGRCRWRARVPPAPYLLVADGDQVWLPWESTQDGRLYLRSLGADGRFDRELRFARGLGALVAADGVFTALAHEPYPHPGTLWRLDAAGSRALTADLGGGPGSHGYQLAPGAGGSLGLLVHRRDSDRRDQQGVVLTVLAADGTVRAQAPLAVAFETAALTADGDGWLVAGMTPTRPVPQPFPPVIHVVALDAALHVRWRAEVPPPPPSSNHGDHRWVELTRLGRRGDQLVLDVHLYDLHLHRRRPGRVVLGGADGRLLHHEDLDTLTPGDTWRLAAAADGDVVAGHAISTERVNPMPPPSKGTPTHAIVLLPPAARTSPPASASSPLRAPEASAPGPSRPR
jgi:hypothetical protein